MKKLKGSITVEMAYILPAVILIFVLVLYTVFYCHDKNILSGAAAETAVLGTQDSRQRGGNEADLQSFYKERVRRKLILLRLTNVDISKGKKDITVTAHAGKGWMRVSAMHRSRIPEPEDKIRNKRRLEALAGQGE